MHIPGAFYCIPKGQAEDEKDLRYKPMPAWHPRKCGLFFYARGRSLWTVNLTEANPRLQMLTRFELPIEGIRLDDGIRMLVKAGRDKFDAPFRGKSCLQCHIC